MNSVVEKTSLCFTYLSNNPVETFFESNNTKYRISPLPLKNYWLTGDMVPFRGTTT